MTRSTSWKNFKPVAVAIAKREKEKAQEWIAYRLSLLPWRWADYVRKEHKRRGGIGQREANA